MTTIGTTGTTQTHRWRWVALAALLVAEAMNMLDTTVVQVAGPVIADGLGGAATVIPWFSAAYTLPFAMLLITGGRLGDIVGRRRTFRVGVTLFALSSTACAVAVLVGARVVQGAAAAMIIPQTFGLIRATFEGAEMARALSWIGPVMGVAGIAGPVVGAALTHADLLGTSWRSVFLVNVPLALGVLALAPLLTEDRTTPRPRLDLPGTALAAVGTGLLVLGVLEPSRWPAAVAGLGVLGLFVLGQRRSSHPLVETSLFADRGFPAALVASATFFAVLNGVMLLVVLYAQLGEGRDVLTAGFTLLTWSGGSALASWAAGAWLVPRIGGRLTLVGLLILAAGLVGALVVYASGAAVWLPVVLAVGGVGAGLYAVPFFTTALGRVRPPETGSAAGLLNAVQQLGATLGVAVLGGLFTRVLGSDVSDGPRVAVVLAVVVALGVVALTALATRVMLAPARSQPPEHGAGPVADLGRHLSERPQPR